MLAGAGKLYVAPRIYASVPARSGADSRFCCVQWLRSLPDDAVVSILQQLPPMPALQLLALVPRNLHAAALKAHLAGGAATLDLSDWGGLHDSARTATAEDALAAAAHVNPSAAVVLGADAAAASSASTFRALAFCLPMLRSLALWGPDPELAAVPALLPGIDALTHLTRLSISSLALGAGCDVAAALDALPQLRDLQLRDVDLRAGACARIAPALARASALSALDIRGNPLGCSGWSLLAHAGLPASLVVLEALDTFEEEASDEEVMGREYAPAHGSASPPPLCKLAHALRACSRLRRLAVGPTVQDVTVGSNHSEFADWGVMCAALAPVHELAGAGEMAFLTGLNALTSLTWGVPKFSRPETVAPLERMTNLRALRLSYQSSSLPGRDRNHLAIFDAAGALTSLTALSLRIHLYSWFAEGLTLQALVTRVLPCAMLQMLDIDLQGGTDAVVGEGGVSLVGLASLSVLKTLRLALFGPVCNASTFQLRPVDVLAFVPASLRELALVVPWASGAASYDATLLCTQLTALRMALDILEGDEEPAMPRPVDALAQRLSQLVCVRELLLADEIHEPCAMAALAALPRLTALEALRICSNMSSFPTLVMAALTGRTALRQLTIVHRRWPERDCSDPRYTQADLTARVVRELVHFSHLERVGLYDREGQGVHLDMMPAELAGVFRRVPRLALLVVHYGEEEAESACALAGRQVTVQAFPGFGPPGMMLWV